MNMKDQNPHRDSASYSLPVEVEDLLKEQPAEEVEGIKEVWALSAHAQQFDVSIAPDAEQFEQMRLGVHAAKKSVRTAGNPGAEKTNTQRYAPLRLISTHAFRIAASLVILVMAGIFWWTRPVIHEAPFGDQLSVYLPDGSEVSLNSGSRLSHARSFGGNTREITLRGEAFFDVAHSDTPFTVETFNGKVTVLGTRFNVRAWDSDDIPETVVVLEKGSVLFGGHAEDIAPVILKPGELSKISGFSAPTKPAMVDVDQRIAWRLGSLMFIDQQIGVVTDEVERRFNVEITVSPELREERVTVRLSDARNAEEVLSVVALARGYKLEQVDGVFGLSMQ